jgi:hypothetical protein
MDREPSPASRIGTGEKMFDNSLVVRQIEEITVAKLMARRSARHTVNSLVRTREYLTGREIERLMVAAGREAAGAIVMRR